MGIFHHLRQMSGSRRRHRKVLLLAGASIIAAALLFTVLSLLLTPGKVPFQPLPTDTAQPLRWTFITPHGENSAPYRSLFPTEEECSQRAGVPVIITFCSMEKYLNTAAAGTPADVVTCWYTDPSFRRLETSGSVWKLQALLDTYIPGFTLPEEAAQWCGNFQGNVYAYPHTGTILSQDDSSACSTALIARKDLLDKFHWSCKDFADKESVLEQLKTIRKASSDDLIPCFLDFSCLQQMFGVTASSESGWTEPFLHPGTLETLEYMNTLFREKLLSHDVFTLSEETLLTRLEQGDIFLASSPQLGAVLAHLPEDSPILEQYVQVEPIRSDSGRMPAFANNFGEQYASTLFLSNSVWGRQLARLLASFYLENMELTPPQEQALRSAGMDELLQEDWEPFVASGLESSYTVPTTHYEVLFSHYSNTRLATVADRQSRHGGGLLSPGGGFPLSKRVTRAAERRLSSSGKLEAVPL